MSQAELFSVEEIQRRIHLVRGQRVIYDADLAHFYGVSTKRLLEHVRRNAERFPGDFCFQLNREEVANLRPQSATSSLQHAGRRQGPWVFGEHGALMAANVLNSPTAARMGVSVVHAFVQLRESPAPHRDLAAKVVDLERKLEVHDSAIVRLFEAMLELLGPAGPGHDRGIGSHHDNP
jgi:hypothetical protein